MSGSGGNGVANKAFESYIRDPLKIPAYLKHLKPIYDHIAAISSEGSGINNTDMFRVKMWYFVPQELKTLPKGTIGVSFLRGKMQQLALQTDRTIWVNSKIFDAPTTSMEDQADLLLHEAVMTLYTVKFKPLSELHRISERLGRNSEKAPTAEQIKMMDALMPPVPARILNSEDYENIRTMMNWLKTEGRTATYKDVVRQLRANEFDQRFSAQDEEKVENPENPNFFVLSTDELQASFERAQVVGRFPSLCKMLGESKEIPCKLSFAKQVRPLRSFNNFPISVLEFKRSLGNSLEVSTDLALSSNGENSISSWGTRDSDGQLIYVLAGSALVDLAKRGDRQTNTLLFFKNKGTATKPRLEIEAMLFIPMVITDVETTDLGSGSESTNCRGERPQSNRLEDQPIFIRAPSFGKANYFLNMLTQPGTFSEVGCSK